MNDYGEVLPKLGVDGQYGSNSEKATIAFQKKRGLIVDGVAGPLTKDTLYKKMLYGW